MSGVFTRNWSGKVSRPALALHCMMGSGSYWGPIFDRLDGRVDLSGFDMPAHGRSDDWIVKPDGPDFHTAVTRIAASMIERPLDLIGHSLGATIALRIAVAAPDAIRSLTLIEPVLFAATDPDTEQIERDRAFIQSLVLGHHEDAARSFIDVWGLGPYDTLPLPARARMATQIGLVADTFETLNNDRANILRDGGLEAIVAPVMLITGENTPSVIHRITDALAARLPDVGRASVTGAGHMLPLTHPDQTAGLIAVNLDRA